MNVKLQQWIARKNTKLRIAKMTAAQKRADRAAEAAELVRARGFNTTKAKANE
jgi:hypothetical protein